MNWPSPGQPVRRDLPLPGAVRHWCGDRLGGGDGISGDAREGHIKIDDILLLFIYLELGAMVGIYFKTNHMPVRFLIYVAITALTRLLISNVSHHNPPDIGIIYLCGGILLLAFSILVVRYARRSSHR
jgi:phosphate starvation-inducible membrane PsiE